MRRLEVCPAVCRVLRPARTLVCVTADPDTTAALVQTRARLVWGADAADVWLISYNTFLGARPVDVVATEGPDRVLAALDAEAAGGGA